MRSSKTILFGVSEKMPVTVRDIIREFARDMRNLFGNSLSRVVVYGSYARGDYTENSDVDVMILVKVDEPKISQYIDQVADCAFDYFMKYSVDISPVIKNEKHFEEWVDAMPYYQNVRDEGVEINTNDLDC